MLAAGNEENGSRIDAWTSADRYGALESETQPILRGMDMMGPARLRPAGARFSSSPATMRLASSPPDTRSWVSGWHLWTLAEFVDRF